MDSCFENQNTKIFPGTVPPGSTRKKISVAMAVCNGEAYLGGQLDSILNQSYPVSEIVICDDRSDDRTWALLTEYRRRYPEIIRPEENPVRLGVAKNFEKAISKTTGELIFLADQDDVWMPDKVEKFAAQFDAFPEAGGCFSDSAITDETLFPTGISHCRMRGFSTEALTALQEKDPAGMLACFLRRVPAAGHDMAFRSGLKRELLPFPGLKECHDTWIGLFLAARHQWRFIPEELTLFRQHSSNVSGAGKRGGLCGKLRQALYSVRNNTSGWNAQLFEALEQRLTGKCAPDVLQSLRTRKLHSAARSRMECPLLCRLPLIWQEFRNGGYFRYGRGMANLLQDLFLRKPW